MMKVQEFLKEHKNVNKLNEQFGIMIKDYPEQGLYVLNYDQIKSPKSDPIVMECRGLILDYDFNVVSRAFDRFFNLGEAPDTQAHLDWSKAVVHDKVDGSLIKLYNYKGQWHVSTRGTAFAESDCMGFGITFEELILKASGVDSKEALHARCELADLDEDLTYILELTARENRVVTVYEGTKLHFLAARNRVTGEFEQVSGADKWVMGWSDVQTYSFDSPEACVKTAEKLPNLLEGYVVYQDGKPVCKVKSPAYVAVHHLRGNGTPNQNRVMELVCIGEHDEYLTYFPEDEKYFTPVVDALSGLLKCVDAAYQVVKDIEDQKDFALRVKDFPGAWLFFTARKSGQTPSEVFHGSELNKRVRTLESSMQK